ncbi:hypothetical protein EVAR_24584_1 [Eumeta japonica]|uniref:Uncharacterized protein n=1 Tax=Eumeta variegata TaxID=151549 RepID=A0A4C1W7T3_EUMVA|nr:hypothetical protein EVAR_24584_1 [Eumeta japonica]
MNVCGQDSDFNFDAIFASYHSSTVDFGSDVILSSGFDSDCNPDPCVGFYFYFKSLVSDADSAFGYEVYVSIPIKLLAHPNSSIDLDSESTFHYEAEFSLCPDLGFTPGSHHILILGLDPNFLHS